MNIVFNLVFTYNDGFTPNKVVTFNPYKGIMQSSWETTP